MERMKFLPEGGNGMRDICSKAQLTSNSFHKPAERLWNERGGAMERMKFSPEGGNGMSDICSDDGAVKVSTGMGKRDKRAAAPDRHKTGNFIN